MEEKTLRWVGVALIVIGAALYRAGGVSAGQYIGYAGIALVVFTYTSRIKRDYPGE